MGQSYEARRLAAQGLKKCTDCKQELPLQNFRVVSGKWPNSFCKACTPIRNKAYREKDPELYRAKLRQRYHESKEHYRDLARRSMYNAPLGTYDLLYKMQAGKCAICGTSDSAKDGRKLSLDHQHDSGIIRGLLCTNCNQGIGSFKENPDLMRQAISYLYNKGFTIEDLEQKLVKDLPLNPEDVGL